MATILTSQGCGWIRDSLTGSSVTGSPTADYIGWGTGAGTATKPDVALFAESSTGISNGGEIRILAARTLSGTDVLQWIGTLTANSSKTITNAGNFTYGLSSTSGNAQNLIIIKGDFTGIAVQANDRIQFTMQMQIT